ncbi:MAG: hypothetical protein HY897_26350 [Deltaproteobacteria bacterium]|nr:hypothetical protein [Deltaproteobacteria bacterium]
MTGFLLALGIAYPAAAEEKAVPAAEEKAAPAADAKAAEKPAQESKPATPPPAKKFLVQKFEAVGVEPGMAKAAEEAVVLDVGQREGLSAVTFAEMEQTIKFAKTQTETGCAELEKCLVEVRKKLSVDTVIVGKLGKMGDDFLLSVNTIDTRTGAALQRATVQAKEFSDLKTQVRGAVDELLGVGVRKKMFQLPAGGQLKLAVWPLVGRGVPAETADSMTQILSAELNQIKGVGVMSQDDIKAMVSKVATEKKLDCTGSTECIVEIGAALGLSKLVIGAVGKVKDTFVISLQLLETRKAEVQSRVLESFAGDADELKNAIKLAAYQVVGVDYAAKSGGVDLTFNVEEAEVQLGEKKAKLKESRYAQKDLTPGRYSLRVLADPGDYFPLQTDLYVAPGAENVRTLTVQEKTHWYQTWWFWTITGVVVAGTVGGIVWATQVETPAGSGTVTVGQ